MVAIAFVSGLMFGEKQIQHNINLGSSMMSNLKECKLKKSSNLSANAYNSVYEKIPKPKSDTAIAPAALSGNFAIAPAIDPEPCG